MKAFPEIAWTVLGTLLAGLVVGAALYDRGGWPDVLPGEGTALMQAASLAHDFDLRYERQDFDRFLRDWKHDPRDVRLASGSEGRRIAFDRPFPYALWLAPFLRLWPTSGFALANALLLAGAALFAARTLERRLGTAGVVAVAVLLFASVAFEHVFLATGDAFLLALTVIAFGLVMRTHDAAGGAAGKAGERRMSRAWLAVGLLLAIVFASQPLAGVLLVAAWFMAPERAASSARHGLLLGAGLGLVAVVVVAWWAGGGLFFFAVERFRFTSATGFPLVDFAAGEWSPTIRHLSAFTWEEAPRFAWGVDPRLWGWDVVDLLFGRHGGLIPYFAPLLLLAAAGAADRARRPLIWAAAAWLVGLVVLHPFDLFGGEGAVGNRGFLPVYGALWWLLARPRRTLWAAPGAALVAALFLGGLWRAPWASPLGEDGRLRYPTAVARAVLPFETGQRWLASGEATDWDVFQVRFLGDGAWAETYKGRLMVDGDARVDLVVASPAPLDAFVLELGADAPSAVELAGVTLRERLLRPDGGIGFRLEPGWPVRSHALWWTPERRWMYRWSFRLPDATGPLAFDLRGIAR